MNSVSMYSNEILKYADYYSCNKNEKNDHEINKEIENKVDLDEVSAIYEPSTDLKMVVEDEDSTDKLTDNDRNKLETMNEKLSEFVMACDVFENSTSQFESWVESSKEEQKIQDNCMKIAKNIKSGANVPANDEAYLCKFNNAMYQLAVSERAMKEKEKDADSVLDDDDLKKLKGIVDTDNNANNTSSTHTIGTKEREMLAAVNDVLAGKTGLVSLGGFMDLSGFDGSI